MVISGKSTERRTLDRDAWIRGAIEALRSDGVDAIRVDTLAPRLGVTRGSFYWHFVDRADLLEAVLADWESETPEIIEGASTAATPYYRLLKFFTLAEASAHPPDVPIFAWARRDSAVARRVERVERQRVQFFERQILELSVQPPEARRIAELLYVATLGFLERRARSTHRSASFGAFGRNVSDLLLTLLPASSHPAESRQPRTRSSLRKGTDL